MSATYSDRISGVETSVAVKAPVVAATTTLIELTGLQTIDGVVLAEGDRVLVKDQVTQSQNGIYNASYGTWTRATDFNGPRDFVVGTTVFVSGGSTHFSDRFFLAAPVASLDSSDVVFAPMPGFSSDVFKFDTIAEFQATNLTSYGDGVIAVITEDSHVPHVKVAGAVTGTAGSVKDGWEPMVFQSPTQMAASVQGGRYLGATWQAYPYFYTEVDTNSGGTDVETAGGAILRRTAMTGEFILQDRLRVKDAPSEFPRLWGHNTKADISTATIASQDQHDHDDDEFNPLASLSYDYFADGALGAGGDRTLPLGLYIQHRQVGTDTANDAYTHSITAYALNDASGNNDVVAISGRAIKRNVAGGVGDAAAIWGSAYNESDEIGSVMALEGGVQQNRAGSTAADSGGAAITSWTMGLHLFSIGSGSAASVAIDIDSMGMTAGNYGFWNGIIIDGNAFAQDGNGAGIAGTVGLNMGSWSASQHAETAIKFGVADFHLRRRGGDIEVDAVKIAIHNRDGGQTGLELDANSGQDTFLDFRSNGTLKGNLKHDVSANSININAESGVDIKIKRNGIDAITVSSIGTITLHSLPTDASGLTSGQIWNDAGTVRVVT